MELKCVVVLLLVSLLSVSPTPHGYGVKSAAVARAEAAAAAFGGGLPLTIPSGPGFLGSFSKSSSSSFASSSASSSSSSFSFSGSGAGFGLNNLGIPGSGGCTGECQNDSKDVNSSHGPGSIGADLQMFNGVSANAAAGALAGSHINSKDGKNGPCSNGVCPEQTSHCDGLQCGQNSEKCKSGQCGPKSSESSVPDHDYKKCATGNCATNSESKSDNLHCENGNCGGQNVPAHAGPIDNNKCASGQCNLPVSTNSADSNLKPNVKCTSDKCTSDSPIPERDNGPKDIPVSIVSTSTDIHDSNNLLDTTKPNTHTTSQTTDSDCKDSTCEVPSKNPTYGYPASDTYNNNKLQPTGPNNRAPLSKPATHLTAPKFEEACSHPNCKPPTIQPEEPKTTSANLGVTKCTGENCSNGQSYTYPSPNKHYTQPPNSQILPASPALICNFPSCHLNKMESKQITPSYDQSPSHQTGAINPSSSSTPLQTKLSVATQAHTQSVPNKCASGECSTHPSHQPTYNIQSFTAPIPTQTQGSDYLSKCPSGHCDSSPIQPTTPDILKPTIPSYSLKPTTNCASGNCGNPANSQPKRPDQSLGQLPSVPGTCALGYCGSNPSYQTNYDIQISKVPTPSQGTGYSPSNQPNPNIMGSNVSQQPFSSGSSNCAFGNCAFGKYPSSLNVESSYPRLPSYPQNILTNKPFDCAAGNCANYSPSHHNASPIGSKFPISSENPSESVTPSCKSGTCRYPTNQHGNIGQLPSGSVTPSCKSGTCRYPTNQHESIGPLPSGSVTSSCKSGTCRYPTNQHGSIGPLPSTNCAAGNCANYPPSHHNASPIGSKFPISSENPSGSVTPSCTSGTCRYPTNQHGSIGPLPSTNCAAGNCANYPPSHHNASPIESKFPISSENPSGSVTPSCTSGTCSNPTYQHGNIGPLPSTNCASGNCANYPSARPSGSTNIPTPTQQYTPSTIPTYVSSIKPIPEKKPMEFGSFSSSGNCDSGNCPSNPSTYPTSHQVQPTASNPSNKIPDFVALGVAGGAKNPESFGPSSIPSSQSTGFILTSSNSATAEGAHSQSSLSSSHNMKDKEQIYTGGFGGPPGILKPYEFTVPSHYLTANNNNRGPSPCPTGKCDAQSEHDKSSNKHDISSATIGLGSCTSGSCGLPSDKPHHEQSNTASGTFAIAAAGNDAVLYTGGFGGPPGILKPYDGGKIGNIPAMIKAKILANAALGGNIDAHTTSGNKLTGYNGVLSGAASTANAGVFGSGNYNGHNKESGCDGSCDSSGHGSYSGHFGIAGGLSKNGLLDKLHNGANAVGAVAQSAASAISGAGSSSFALGGNFASSSASAHSLSGSTTKGGYGR